AELGLRRALRPGDRRAADPGSGAARLADRPRRSLGAGHRADALRLPAGGLAGPEARSVIAAESAPPGRLRAAGRDASAVPAATGRRPSRQRDRRSGAAVPVGVVCRRPHLSATRRWWTGLD